MLFCGNKETLKKLEECYEDAALCTNNGKLRSNVLGHFRSIRDKVQNSISFDLLITKLRVKQL